MEVLLLSVAYCNPEDHNLFSNDMLITQLFVV